VTGVQTCALPISWTAQTGNGGGGNGTPGGANSQVQYNNDGLFGSYSLYWLYA
jgi:hypothetical protein